MDKCIPSYYHHSIPSLPHHRYCNNRLSESQMRGILNFPHPHPHLTTWINAFSKHNIRKTEGVLQISGIQETQKLYKIAPIVKGRAKYLARLFKICLAFYRCVLDINIHLPPKGAAGGGTIVVWRPPRVTPLYAAGHWRNLTNKVRMMCVSLTVISVVPPPTMPQCPANLWRYGQCFMFTTW